MKTTRLFVTALAALALSACSQDETPEVTSWNGEISVRASLAGLDAATRSSQYTGYMVKTEGETPQWFFKQGIDVDLFLDEPTIDGKTKTYNNTLCYLQTTDNAGAFSFYNVGNALPYTRNTEAGAIPKYWPASGNGLYFYAWYPKNKVTTLASNGSMVLTADQGTAAASDDLDLLFGKPQAQSEGHPVARPTGATMNAATTPLIFTHSLSKVTVVLQGDGHGLAASDAQLTGATVTVGSDFSPSVSINPRTGVCTKSETANQTFTLKAAGNTALTNWAVVAPGEQLNGKTITITLAHGGVKQYVIPQNNSQNVMTEAGKEYKYTITLGLYEIKVTNTITDWQNGATVAPDPLYI